MVYTSGITFQTRKERDFASTSCASPVSRRRDRRSDDDLYKIVTIIIIIVTALLSFSQSSARDRLAIRLTSVVFAGTLGFDFTLARRVAYHQVILHHVLVEPMTG